MGKFNKLFEYDIMIQNAYGHAITALRKLTVKNWHQLLEKNRELKGQGHNKRCYVIGLGPSLRDIDLSKIDGDSIVVNRFNVFDGGKFQPTYYMLADSAYFVNPLKKELHAVYKMYPNTKFIMDGMYRDSILEEIGEDLRVYYTFSGNGVFNHKQKIDYAEWSSVKYNVVAGAIAMAMYMEYSEIILLGCDFNSFASPKAIHCYDEKNDNRLISLSFELYCYSFAAYVHEELARYATNEGIKILNATEGSLIDAYEKVSCTNYLKDSVKNEYRYQQR